MAITVGSVEVDVIPNVQGITTRLRAALVPAGTQVGDELGQIIGRQIASQVQDGIRTGLTVGGQRARPAATRAGDDSGGAFGRTFRARVEAAMRNLPKANVGADTTGFDAQMDRLRARLETLGNKRVGVDVDAATALAEIDRLEADLARLGAEHPNVNVRVDTAAAIAELAALRADIARMDGQDINVRADVDASSATASLGGLTTVAMLFGPALIPVLPVVAAGLGAIAAAGIAAGVGLAAVGAVALPGIQSISTALQAQKAAQQAVNTTSTAGASKALALAGAQQALATAERNGARQIVQAQAQVVQAKRAVADAVAAAAQSQQQADRAVKQAETDLAGAQKSATQAQLDLVAARKTATQQLQDMNNSLADSKLSERDATLAMQQAQLDLNATLADPKATALQRAQAQLTFDQAVQHLKEQQQQTARLKTDTAAANKAGVAGSATVKAAQDQVAQAQQTVADKTQALSDAQAAQAQQQVQNARAISDAQAKVADATANVAVAQQSAADSVASAQRQIQTAQLSTSAVASAAETAQAKYRAELAKMTPATRDTFNAFLSLRTAFDGWSRSLQPAVMPIFTRALVGVKNALPGITPLVLAAADAISGLQDKVSAGFKSPWWQTFKKDLNTSVGPAITGLGVSFGRIFKGIVGIIDAFLPHMNGIGGTMERIAGRFADWGTSLRNSPGFEHFLQYAKDGARAIWDLVVRATRAVVSAGKAFAPLAGVVFAAVGPLLDAVTWLTTNLPGLLQTLWGLYAVNKAMALGMKAYAVAMGLYATVTEIAALETFTWAAALQATGVPALIGAIVVVVALLVAGVIWAYKNVGWFRAAVDAAWNGIKAATMFMWNSVLKPAFDGIVTAVKAVGTAAMWLWTNAIGPAFRFIWAAARLLATILIVVVIAPIVIAFKLLSMAAMWLWNNAIKPVFGWIADKAVWLYKNVLKPQFDLMVRVLHALGDAGRWLYDKAIRPTFNWIADKARWLYANVIKPQFNLAKTAFRALGDAASWLYNKAIRPAFNWISDKARWLWNNALKPQFDAMKKGVRLIGDAFKSAKDFIGKQWSKVSDLAKKPIKFIIDTVYNKGIVGVWKKVADITGADPLKPFTGYGFARGGVLPGYTPGKDVHSFYSPTGGTLGLSGGEAIMRPEFTRAVGPAAVGTLNAAARSGGVAGVRQALGFADGGILGSIKGAVSTGIDWAKTGAELLTNPGKAWDAVTGPIKSLIGKAGSSKWAKHVAGIPTGWLKNLGKTLADAVGSIGGGSGGSVGGSGVKRWSSVVLQSLGLVGQPASLLDTVLRRMNQESGGNPTVVNKWDSNWLAGHPSVGLMQLISGTFKGYAGQFKNTGPFSYGVSTNPLANVYASMKYAMSRYGNLSNAYNRPGGYDSGGYLQPGLNLAYNGTGRPEPVFTSAQANALMGLAASPAGLGDLNVQVWVGDREITDIARAEVHASNGQLVQTLRAGRRG